MYLVCMCSLIQPVDYISFSKELGIRVTMELMVCFPQSGSWSCGSLWCLHTPLLSASHPPCVTLIFTAPPLLSVILSAPPFDDMSASLFEDSYCEKMQSEVFNKALF